MAYDEGLAQRVAEFMTGIPNVNEKKMFGGIAFMVNGNMSVGITGGELMVRVGAEYYTEALNLPYAREMDFTGKALKGFVYVSPEGLSEDDDLMAWINWAVTFVQTLPAK